MNTPNQNQTTSETRTKSIIELTPAAINKIKAMMDKDGKADHYLRVGVLTGGCAGLSYDMSFQKKVFDNDYTDEQGGIRIAINEDCETFLSRVKIDYVDSLKESGFKYINPNAKSSCGCGTSFS